MVGESDGNLNYFENTGTGLAPAFTERTGTANPLNGIDVGTSSTPSFADVDSDGDLDAVVGEDNGNLNYFENVAANRAPNFVRRISTDNPFNGIDVGYSSSPSIADLDGDGDLDAVIGTNTGTLSYYVNTGTGLAPSLYRANRRCQPVRRNRCGRLQQPKLCGS